MIDLYKGQTNQLLGSVTDADLQVLIDKLEEESSEDRDYYIDMATIVTNCKRVSTKTRKTRS